MLEWIDNKDGSFSLLACLLFGIGIIIAGYIHGHMDVTKKMLSFQHQLSSGMMSLCCRL